MIKLNFGACLNLVGDFIKKYPEYIQEITLDFSHVLFIPENLVIKEIIFLQDILREYNIKNLLIILEKNSSVKIYNNMLKVFTKSLDPSQFFSIACEHPEFRRMLNSGRTWEGECVCDFRIESEKYVCDGKVGSISFNLRESSRLEFFTCLTGEHEIEFNLSVNLLGENANANVTGFYLAGKNQKINMQTNQKHLVRNTFSNLVINGVLADRSQVKYCGKIFVAKDAIGVKASQENKNIVLGENVSLDASPELEVLNNEVECKHGCAMGQFDQKKLFYLQSRGLDKNRTILLLIESFFGFINNLDCDMKLRESLFEGLRNKVRESL